MVFLIKTQSVVRRQHALYEKVSSAPLVSCNSLCFPELFTDVDKKTCISTDMLEFPFCKILSHVVDVLLKIFPGVK